MTPRLLVLFSPWKPQRLFRNGERGAIYDPSNLDSLFQDAAGTTPVTAVGQAVGKMLDLSGNGNHLTQATPTNCATLEFDSGGYYLQPDASDDSMSCSSFGWAGANVIAAAAVSIPAGTLGYDLFGTGGVTAPAALLQPKTSVAGTGRAHVFTTAGTISVDFPVTDGALSVASQRTNGSVLAGRNDLDAPVTTALSGTFSGAGTFVLFSRDGTLSLYPGKFYGGVIRVADTSDADWDKLIRYLGKKQGRQL